MSSRLDVLLELIGNGDVLADVGCDHGFVSYNALKNKLYKRVIISDISEKSLNKAKQLLKPFGDKVESYVCDGLSLYEGKPTVCIISGMGGEEIIHILSSAKILPDKLILAPQKNTDKVRETVINKGYALVRDFTFLDGKIFYDFLVCEKLKDTKKQELSSLELKYGVENIKTLGKDFVLKIKKEIEFLNGLILSESVNSDDKAEFLKKIIELKGVINET